MKKNKILFLDHTPFVGGAQLSLLSHLKYLDKNKFEIIVGCSRNAKILGLAGEYEKIGVNYYFLPFEKLKTKKITAMLELIKSVKATMLVIKKDQINIVFGNTVRADIVGSLATLFTGKKIVWFIQDVTFPKILFKILSNIPSRILFVSKYVADFYSAKNNEKNRVVYIWREEKESNDVDLSSIRKEIRGKWDVGDNVFVIGCVGRLVKDKGVQILIKAFQDLVFIKNIKNIKCVVVGSSFNQGDNYELYLKSLVKEFGLEKYFIFEGHKDEVFLYFKSFDIFCQPSIAPEGLPTVVLEAALAKIPVIASRVGGTEEVVNDGENGLLVAPNDSNSLSDAIEKMINNPDLRFEFSQRAYSQIKSNFSCEKKTREIEKIYLEIINN